MVDVKAIERAKEHFGRILEEQLRRVEEMRSAQDWIDYGRLKVIKIGVCGGDGIGPEVMAEVKKIIGWMGAKRGIRFDVSEDLVGGCAYDAHGTPLTDATMAKAQEADAVLLGAVGGPKWDNLPFEKKPERGLLRLRKDLGLFANLRPAKCFDALVDASSLKPELVRGLDIMIVRELTGGLYFGQPKKTEEYVVVDEEGIGGKRTLLRATDTMVITTEEIERIAHVGFEAARLRRKKLSSIDKANVLENGVLWRDVVTTVGKEYPDVRLEHVFVDNAAMQLILNPSQYDVLLCENMFGDILSDEAAALAGSLGMLPSASLGETSELSGIRFGLYEPAGGSAPDIAGKGIANPVGAILSAVMMLDWLGENQAAAALRRAVELALAEGNLTQDLGGKLTTAQLAAAVAERVAP